MTTRVVTLQKEGYLSDIDKKIDYLMCCYFFSKYSQSTLYYGNVFSLMKIIQMHGNEPVSIQTNVENSLQTFLSKWFQNVQVSVSVDENIYPGIGLIIDATVTDNVKGVMQTRSIGYSLLINDSRLKSITNMNNGISIM